MSGTRAGGLKTVQVIKNRYGEDYYHKLGKIGGSISVGGGFSRDPGLASTAGTKGGSTPRKNTRQGRILALVGREGLTVSEIVRALPFSRKQIVQYLWILQTHNKITVVRGLGRNKVYAKL
jgi:general stress protein YciG